MAPESERAKPNLTAEIFRKYRERAAAANPERLHELEQDVTRNRHSADCWCVGEATKLAKKEGYL
jgi:hypothetical protein